MTVHLNIGGTYKTLSAPSVNIGGTWKAVTGIWNNIGGVWKSAYAAVTYTMRIATSPTGTNECSFQKTGLGVAGKTIVAEGVVKVETSGSSRGHFITVGNGVKQAILSINGGNIICNHAGTSPYTHTMNTTTAYHTYRVELQGTTQAVFYVDGTPVHTASYANLYANTTNIIYFGDVVTAANYGGSLLWKSVKYNLDLTGTPAAYVEWTAALGLPSANGWTAVGTTSLATIITE